MVVCCRMVRGSGNGSRRFRWLGVLWLCVLAAPTVLGVGAGVCGQCPPACSCWEEPEGSGRCLVDCGQKDLDEFPSADTFPQPLSSVTQLIVKENEIKELPGPTLSLLLNLVSIDASNNLISSIPKNLFSNLTNLEELNLLENRISSLTRESFAGLSKLKTLVLTRNKFVRLESGIFDELVSLEILSINVMRSLKKIDSGIFNVTSHLKKIYMNRLSLTDIPPDLFRGLGELERLKLSENNLSGLPSGVFSNLPSLTSLSLANNPWRCDCGIRWLILWLGSYAEHGFRLEKKSNTKCQYPEIYATRTITSLKETELNCDFSPALFASPLVAPHTPPYHNARSNRSVRSPLMIATRSFQSSWNTLCKYLGSKLNKCKGPGIFMSCGRNQSSGNVFPVAFSKASYTPSKSDCMQDCFDNGLKFGNFHNGKICLCGSAFSLPCSDSCDASPKTYAKFCGKYFLPHTIVVTADLVVSPMGVLSSQATFEFSVSANLHVTSYTWDFGEGDDVTYQTSSGTLKFSYFYAGDYLLSVNVVSGKGSETAKIPIRVRDNEPTASLHCPAYTDASANISVLVTSGYQLKLTWLRQDGSGAQMKDFKCSGTWQAHRDKCVLFQPGPLEYAQAQVECGRLRGELLTLDHAEEIDELIDQTEGSTEKYFIGALRLHGSGPFEWTSSGNPAHVVNSQVPASSAGDCVALQKSGLFAVPCNTPAGLICQKAPEDCSSGGSLGPDGYCYILSDSPTTWDMAERGCAAYPQGGLVVIKSDVMHRFISYSILGSSGETEAWIGLNDRSQEGYFVWTDRTGEDASDVQSFDESEEDDDSVAKETNWSSLHATVNNAGLKDCVMLHKEGTAFRWLEDVCTKPKPFLCRYSNAGETLSVGSYGAGTLIFTEQLYPPARIIPVTDLPATSQTHIYLLPGLWFSESGVLNSWEFISDPVLFPSFLVLLVLRPFCSTGHLIKPGCSSKPSRYARCLATRNSCDPVQSCEIRSQYCGLSSSCHKLKQPCSCAALPANTAGCSMTSSVSATEFAKNSPQYRVVGSVRVKLANGNKARYVISGQGTSVEEGDIFAYQLNAGSSNGVFCQTNAHSRWRQSMYLWNSGGWEQNGSVIQVPGNITKVDNVVCFLRTKFYKTVLTKAPASLSHFRSPGVYTFSVDVSGDVRPRSLTCDVKSEERISGLTIIHPKIISPGRTKGSLGTIPIEFRSLTDIVIRVTHGSHLNAYWDHLRTTSGIPFINRCPSSLVDSPACFLNTSEVTIPFSSITLKLDVRSPMESLKVTVKNHISSEELSVDLSKAFRIRGLKVKLSETQKHSISASGYIQVPANETVSLKATLIQGSSVTYKWSINASHISMSKSSNKFDFKFSTPGQFVVEASASNVINSEENQITVLAIQRAMFKDVDALMFSEIVPRDVPINMSFVAGVSIGAKIEIHSDLGDGSAATKSFITDTTHIVYPIYNTYSVAGNYVVNVTFTSVFQVVSVVKNLSVVNPISAVEISSKENVISLSNRSSFHVVAHGQLIGSVRHTWDFGDGISMNYTGANVLVRHKFTKPGLYYVLVTVTNGVSTHHKSMEVLVQEEISNLTLMYDGPKASQMPVHFQIDLSGSNSQFSIETQDGPQYNTTSLTFEHTFSASGVFNVTVTAWNKVSRSSAVLVVYALSADMLEVVALLAPGCTKIGEDVNLTVNVINAAPIPLFYTWSFGDGITFHYKDVPSVQHRYNTSGLYSVIVQVNNTVKAKSTSALVCVEEPVTGVTLNKIGSAVGYAHGSDVDVRTTATIQTGSNVSFTWKVTKNGPGFIMPVVQCSGCEKNFHIFTFSEAGVYDISVTASNNVSSVSTDSEVRVQEVVENILLVCSNCEDKVYLASNTTAVLHALCQHGTSKSYSWAVDNHSPVISVERSYKVLFADVRSYNVAVEVYNDVSSANDSITVIVQEAVTELHIHTTSTDVLNEESLTFVAEFSNGTDLSFIWSLCPDCINKTGSSKRFSYQFKKSGVYDVSLVARNFISEAHASMKIYSLAKITNVKIQCNWTEPFVPSGEFVLFTALLQQQIKVKISWDIQLSGVSVASGGGWNVTYYFHEVGLYTIKASATNGLSIGSADYSLTVQEKISDFQLLSKSPYVSVGQPVTIETKLTSGTDVVYKWSITNSSASWVLPTSAPLVNVNFQISGVQNLSCVAKNNVSEANGTLEFTAQERIISLTIDGLKSPVIKSSTTVMLQANAIGGSDIMYQWYLNNTKYHSGQDVTFRYTFKEAGTFQLGLTASNQISHATAGKIVVVQKSVTDLEIVTDSLFVRTNETVEFSGLSSGTHVLFQWEIKNSVKPTQPNAQNFSYIFPFPDTYTIGLTGSNNVSSESTSLVLSVQDPIGRLSVKDCCGGTLTSNVPYVFTASVSKGTNVTYKQEVLNNADENICTSKQELITCTFPASGIYTLRAVCGNEVSQETRIYSINVQSILKDISVNPVGPGWAHLYQGQPVTFQVSGNGVSDAHTFEWHIETLHFMTLNPELKHTFKSEGNYSMVVTIKNRISNSTYSKVVTVHKFLCEMPVLEAIGTSSRVAYPSRSIEFSVSIDTRNCTTYTAVHLWRVFDGGCSGDHTLVALPDSVSINTPLLRIPKGVLTHGSFCVRFISGYSETVVRSDINYTLIMKASPLMAIIKGGTERLLPSREVTLDGSKSYDPDARPGDSVQMTYQWDCSYTLPQGTARRKACLRAMFGKTVEIPEGALLPGRLYTITLTVSLKKCVQGSDCRIGIAKQQIQISPDAVPVVEVDCLSCRATDNYRLSSSQHVAMVGSCKDCHDDDVQYFWTVAGFDAVRPGRRDFLDLDSTTTTTGANATDLVIRRGVLTDGQSYIFKLKITKTTQTSFAEGHASLVLGPNNPPSNGNCKIYPSSGMAVPLETLLTVDCKGWSDPGNGSSLFYLVSLERRLATGKLQQCVLYHGMRSRTGVYLSHWPDQPTMNTVTVRVDVLDGQGASTLATRKDIQLTAPQLTEGETLSSHIVNLALRRLRLLLKQYRPSSILRYSVVVLMELNRAASMPRSLPDAKRRALLKQAIATVLPDIPIESIHDIQQIAFAVEQITTFSSDVKAMTNQVVIGRILKRLLTRIQTEVKQGLDCEDFAPSHLLQAVSNLLKASSFDESSLRQSNDERDSVMNVEEFKLPRDGLSSIVTQPERITRRRTQKLITDTVGFTESIMSSVLMTQLQSERQATIDVSDIQLMGQRTLPGHIWTERVTAGCQFILPVTLLSDLPPDQEIFQIMYVLPSNPFTWGYKNHLNITSEVPSLTFQYSNGSEIPIESLPAGNQIQVIMHSTDSDYKGAMESPMQTMMMGQRGQSEYLETSNITLHANTSKKVLLNVSKAGDVSDAALHIQIRCSLESMARLPMNSSLVSLCVAYLGVDYEASEDRYEEKKTISRDMMENESDHLPYTFFIDSRSFREKSEYSVSVYNPLTSSGVTLSVGVYLSSCQYFSPGAQQWESRGCLVGNQSLPHLTLCCCNHLTSFGASSLVPPNAIDFADLGSLSLDENPIALITCCILLGAYILLALICRRKDEHDIRQICKVPLCGVDGSFKYEVTVVTGRHIYAGSTANIGVKIYGEEGKSGSRHLCKPGAFRRNSQDTFLVANDTSLGRLWKVRIWHDNAGLSPGWYLIQVVVRDLQTDLRYLFMANCWLSLHGDNGYIQKEIIVSDPHKQWGFSQLYGAALSRGMCDQHIWLSVLDRPPQSRFSRVQRLTCCFTLLFSFMAINIVWYGAIKTSGPQSGLRGWQYLSLEEFAVGTVSSLLVFLVIIPIAYIFRKTRCKENMFEASQKPQSAKTVEIDDDCISQKGSSLRTGSLERESTGFGRESSGESFVREKTKPLYRTSNFPRLPSENSEDSLYNTLADSDSGVSSRNKDNGLSPEDRVGWTNDIILTRWPELNLRGEHFPMSSLHGQTVNLGKEERGAKVDRSLRMSGIQVGDIKSDDGWSSSLEDINSAEHLKEDKKSVDVKELRVENEWSLENIDDPESWKRIKAELCEEGDGERRKNGDKDVEKPVTPRAGAMLHRSRLRRRSLSGPSGGLPLDSYEQTSAKARKMSLDSVKANILFGRERDKTSSSISTRRGSLRERKMSVASRLSLQLNRMLLPRGCLYVAYGLCLAVTALSVLLILLYANQLGAVGTWRWIASLVLSFLFSAFFAEPLKVALLAVFVALVTRKVDEVEDDDAIEIRPMIEANEKLKDVKFRPLGGYALLQAKEDAKKIRRMYQLIRQFLAYFFLLCLVIAITGYSNNASMYQFRSSMHHKFAATQFNKSQTFYSIDSIEAFWQWSEAVLLPSLLGPGNNLYMGPVRLLQVRSVPATCTDTGYLPLAPVSGCFGNPWFKEDTELYQTTTGEAVPYTSAQELDEGSVSLELGDYSGGGYIKLLPNSGNQTAEILTPLLNNTWLDQHSRVVIVDMTVYNAALDLTCLLRLAVEFPVTGKALPSADIAAYRLLLFTPGYVHPLLVCQVMLGLVLVYFTAQCVLTLRSDGCVCLTRLTVWLELMMTGLMFTSVLLFIMSIVSSSQVVKQYLADPSQYVCFRRTAGLHRGMLLCQAGLAFCVLLKVAQQLRFSKALYIFEKTLNTACGKILGIFILFIILLMTYAQLAYLMFGRTVHGYRSFQASVLSVVSVLRGSTDFQPLMVSRPLFTPLYVSTLWILVYGGIVSLLIAVLRDTFRLVHSQMFYRLTLDPHDYEMIEFMIKRFKKWAGFIAPKPAFPRVRFAGLPSLSSASSSTVPSTNTNTQSSSSSDYYGMDTDESMFPGPSSANHLDQLPAKWEDVLMKMRQLEEMDRLENSLSQQIGDVVDDWQAVHTPAPPTVAGKPPTGYRGRTMSDTRSLRLFRKPSAIFGRKSVSPPSSDKQQSLSKRPHSDEGVRLGKKLDNKRNVFSRLFKKAW